MRLRGQLAGLARPGRKKQARSLASSPAALLGALSSW